MSLLGRIEEMQGLYGPFSVSERLIQKIWLRQDFQRTELTTVSGKRLQIKDPGRWNLHEGPDFLEARLVLDSVPVVGDVEIHFSAQDWWAHAHTVNPNFNRVVLHVLLFEPEDSLPPVKTMGGRTPETFVLLSVLERDLESYAMDQALLELESQDELEWVAEFVALPLDEREAILSARAEARWQQKLAFAQKRLKQTDWAELCHQYLLEVFGYSRNRAPMARVALENPLAKWQSEALDPSTLFASQRDAWKLKGLRPANHPRLRLQQYAAIVQARPEWPERIIAWAKELPMVNVETEAGAFRKATELPDRLSKLSDAVFAGQIGSTRLNTLCVDALLPLLSAAGYADARAYWQHWYPGDLPVALRRFLKYTGMVSRAQPYSNGRLQAALSLSLTQGVD